MKSEMVSTYVSLVALFISALSVYLAFKNNRRFASHQFINRQIDVIAELLKSLHNDIFKIDFVPQYNGGSKFSYHIMASLFEVSLIRNKNDNEILNNLGETVIYFDSTCNQLVQIKEFINNPYLPKSIANALLNFYSIRLTDIPKHELNGEQLILLTTGHFEPGSITGEVRNTAVLKQSDAKALYNWCRPPAKYILQDI